MYRSVVVLTETNCEVFSKDKEKGGYKIQRIEVEGALRMMKKDKATGPSGVVLEMIKAADSSGVNGLSNIFNMVIKEGHIPEDLKSSLLIPIYKGKMDQVDYGRVSSVQVI